MGFCGPPDPCRANKRIFARTDYRVSQPSYFLFGRNPGLYATLVYKPRIARPNEGKKKPSEPMASWTIISEPGKVDFFFVKESLV